MRDSDADIAINTLNKLITQELKAARAGSCQGNRPLEECATTRSNAYAFARDKIKEALADAVEERDAGNPFLPRRDELVTQDMHTCDLCGRWCSGPVYRVCLCYADQSRVASEVCADCMWRLGFRPVRTVPLAVLSRTHGRVLRGHLALQEEARAPGRAGRRGGGRMSDMYDLIESGERRRQLAQAWEAGYSAGWTDQQCDFPPHTADNPFKEDADE